MTQAILKKFFRLTQFQHFCVLFFLLSILYVAWWIASWPGILGQDSLATILEVESNQEFQSGKPAFWALYAIATYGPWRLVEIPIAIQLLLCAIVCARVLSWMLQKMMYKSFLYCLLFVALAPSVVYYASSLYSDGIYAISTAAMLFEIWRIHQNKKIDSAAACILLITIPFSLFSRPNGIINIIAILVLAYILSRRERIKLAMIVIPWLMVALYAQLAVKQWGKIGTVFPVALYETVGFLENRPMGLWENNEPRVTNKTIDALRSHGETVENILKYYDHYYWDPLVFFPKGPALMALPKSAKQIIVHEFFKYNLWHNFPAFAASRVNIFLYAAFADGGFPGIKNAEHILPQTKSKSIVKFRNGILHKYLSEWFDFTFKYRVIFWTPWLGLWLIAIGISRTWRARDMAGFTICTTLLLQLIAVFSFSIAGEYRYLLAFFTAPLALLPAIYAPIKNIKPETKNL